MRGGLSYAALMAALGALLVAALLASLLVGPAGLGPGATFAALFGGANEAAGLIVREVRLPRTLLAAMVGGTLGVSGAALQGYLRNPLAEPGVIGVSGAAALGAVVALYSGLAALVPLALPVLAIAGAALCVALLQALAARGGVLTLILAGLAVSSLSGALISLALNLSPNPYAALEIVFWLLGSLADRSMQHVALAAPFMVAGGVLLALSAPPLDALSLGEEAAGTMGVNLGRTRFLVVAGCALGVGAAVAVSGVIGFVGLVVPHVLRPLVGHRPGRLLAASALGGAVLLLAADILTRGAAPAMELRLGVVTALIGAPFFLILVLRARLELEP